MNAERLHAVAQALRDEVHQRQTMDTMQAFVNALQTLGQTSNSTTQQTLAAAQTAFYSAITDTPSDHFSPTCREILEELGGETLFGNPLRKEIDAAMERNQMTPAVAAEEINIFLTALANFVAGLDQLLLAFALFRIGAEQLAPGECEIGELIPRKAVGDNLLTFAEELKIFGQIVQTFSEIATGTADELKVKTVSSSDFLIFLNAKVELAAAVAFAIERIVALYKTLLDIRKIKEDLNKNKKLPQKIQEGFEEYIETHMTEGIDELTEEIIEKYYKNTERPAERRNEMKVMLKLRLNQMALKIDAGFNFEVRCEPLSDTEEKSQKTRIAEAAIAAAQPNMQFLRLDGSSILQLPNTEDEVRASEEKHVKKPRRPAKPTEPKTGDKD